MGFIEWGNSTVLVDGEIEQFIRELREEYPRKTGTWDDRGYPVTGGKNNRLKLHQLVLGCPLDKSLMIDHVNGNKADARRDNLRWCSSSQNGANSRKRKKGYSRFKGVTFDKKRNKWIAQIKKEYKKYYLGSFEKENTLV
jgi:hypothetical protein